MSPAVHHEQHVANVNANAAGELRVEEDVAGERVPVAVEGQSDETVLSVEHGRAAVAARDVVGGEEAELHVARLRVGIGCIALGAEQLLHHRLHAVVLHLVARHHLAVQAGRVGVVA